MTHLRKSVEKWGLYGMMAMPCAVWYRAMDAKGGTSEIKLNIS